MEITTAVVSSLLSRLAELLRDEYKLQKGVKQQIEFLSKELRDVSEMPLPHDVSRSLQVLSYDMEDSIDSVICREGFINKCASLWAMRKTLCQFNLQIREIKIRAREVKDRRSSYKIDYAVPRMGSGPLVEDPRLPALFKEASGLVGMDRPRDELINQLLMEHEDPSRIKVLPIVGFGGVGKTTLAKAVYDKTKEHFQCGAWVTVSRNPNMEQILIDILHQIQDPHSSRWSKSERDLFSRTNRSLQGKRYLIVLDGLWSTSTLEIIRTVLPQNNFGSRVIVTTRKLSVAEACCSSYWNGRIHNILPLSSKESWMLFNRRIFGENYCPPDFVDVVEKILRKCSGVPLSIGCISSLLACKPPSRPEWEDFSNSIPPSSESIDATTKALLQFSFYNLPHHLRVCLLYLGLFPEDYPMKCDCIIWLWIAEGFVLENSVTTLKEVGHSYLTELINRSMIQPVYGTYDGKLEAIRIHGMVLDLIRSMLTEENFVSIPDKSRYPERVLNGNFRRLSIINTNENNCIPESVAKSPIRSLFIFGRAGLNISFKRLPLLRVLDLEGCKDLRNHSVIGITKLVHLRYLSIRDTPITDLPYQIVLLQLLKTLDLRGTEVHELPTSIVRLPKLENLLCDKMRFPEGIGKMASLSCLSQLDIQSKLSVMTELGNLSELRELKLWWFLDRESKNTEVYENLAISLCKLSKLQSLCIRGDDSSVDLLDYLHHPLNQLKSIQLDNRCYLNRIPNSFTSLASLEYACIAIKEVKNEDLHLLSELCSLLHLSLSSRAVPTENLVIGGNGFPVLRVFLLHSARADLTFEPQAMQKVEKLVVSLPARICGIEHLMCLKTMEIRTSKVFQEVADVAIRKAADEHPNHPIVHIVAVGDLDDYATKEGNLEQNLELIKDYEVKEGNEMEENLETVKAKRL